MEPVTLIVYLLAALVGSYVQSVTGFAMGMIIIAVTVGGGILDVPVITAVVSLISLVNIALALHGRTHHLRRSLLLWLCAGLVPATFLGVFALQVLDSQPASSAELIRLAEMIKEVSALGEQEREACERIMRVFKDYSAAKRGTSFGFGL